MNIVRENLLGNTSAIDEETLEKGRKLVRSDLQKVKKAEDALRSSVTDNNAEDARIAIRNAFGDLWAYQPDILFLEEEAVGQLHESARRCLELVGAAEDQTDCIRRCNDMISDTEHLMRLLIVENDVETIRDVLVMT